MKFSGKKSKIYKKPRCAFKNLCYYADLVSVLLLLNNCKYWYIINTMTFGIGIRQGKPALSDGGRT
jgi:hypothetical protein